MLLSGDLGELDLDDRKSPQDAELSLVHSRPVQRLKDPGRKENHHGEHIEHHVGARVAAPQDRPVVVGTGRQQRSPQDRVVESQRGSAPKVAVDEKRAGQRTVPEIRVDEGAASEGCHLQRRRIPGYRIDGQLRIVEVAVRGPYRRQGAATQFSVPEIGAPERCAAEVHIGQARSELHGIDDAAEERRPVEFHRREVDPRERRPVEVSTVEYCALVESQGLQHRSVAE